MLKASAAQTIEGEVIEAPKPVEKKKIDTVRYKLTIFCDNEIVSEYGAARILLKAENRITFKDEYGTILEITGVGIQSKVRISEV